MRRASKRSKWMKEVAKTESARARYLRSLQRIYARGVQ
jgi:hypothetical protein